MSTSKLGLLCLLVSFRQSQPAAADDDLVALGRLIFFDTNLSEPPGQSCATCHDPAAGWTGPDAEINAAGAAYEGALHGRFGNRKPPTAAYATQSPPLHLDPVGCGSSETTGIDERNKGLAMW